MVVGLDIFKEYFENYQEAFVLIGGAACYLNMNEVGVEFRATKDLDLVLCVEALDPEFIKQFWQFIKDGQYQINERSYGERIFYRFQKPLNSTFPYMIELFSRTLDIISLDNNAVLTPIPAGADVSSLSAILLDTDYYNWLQQGKINIDGIMVVSSEFLIPLKAQAWLDLTERKKAGNHVDSKNIKKHKNDIFRLFEIIDPEMEINTPTSLQSDVIAFLNKIAADQVNGKQFSFNGITVDQLAPALKHLFSIL